MPISLGSGVVCANFGQTQGNGLACNGGWHGACYKQHPSDSFPVLQATDLDDCFLGAEYLEDDDPNRFKHARDGDHLMCPFQCNDCHFYNIQQRPVGAKVQDPVC